MRRPGPSALARFRATCEARTGRTFADWPDFHAFSVAEFRAFWALFVDWAGVRLEGDASIVCAGDDVMGARFFPGARLSFTEHVLAGRGAGDDAIAIVECHEHVAPVPIRRGDLRRRVARAAATLARRGIGPGDRVAAIAAHDASTIVAALAVTGLGASWSSCGPELATDAVVSRFSRFSPKLLLCTRDFVQGGVAHDLGARADEVAAALPAGVDRAWLDELATEAAADDDRPLGEDAPAGVASWPRFPFDHPLFVLYSSGTTGAAKAIVHGAGGTLLEHLKEHLLHGDLGPDDRLYYQTSTGWMMWHWTLTALATGAAIVTYDGAIAHPGADALWRLAADTGVTRFGASPAYFQHCRDAGVKPSDSGLATLRTAYSTGSPLHAPLHDWITEALDGVPVQSISGGTDIIGCFVLGNPDLPVRAGESQCVSLALDVRALASADGGPAELVCGTPFPSRPVAFLDDPAGALYRDTYFRQHPGLWTHGDFIELTPGGGARILGRSDGVLKVRGVRIGPVEITSVAESLPEVVEAMAVEQRAPAEPGGSRIVLLAVLRDGMRLERPLVHRIKRAIRDRTSTDHVPAVIVAVPELPVTVNGKRSERAARDAIEGRPIANLGALRNPRSLDILRDHGELRVD